MCNPGNENCYRIHLYIQERRKPNGEYSVFSIAHYRVDYYLLGYNNDNNDNNNRDLLYTPQKLLDTPRARPTH
jgi:hypothetical protein